jgi:hypothetical protein
VVESDVGGVGGDDFAADGESLLGGVERGGHRGSGKFLAFAAEHESDESEGE